MVDSQKQGAAMRFVIQEINNFDFVSTSVEMIKYQIEFLNLKESIEIVYFDEEYSYENGDVPIGNIEFTENFFSTNHKIIPKPLNVPECLFLYAKRKIHNFNEFYTKNNDKIRHSQNGIHLSNIQISENVPDIQSEYRCFVFQNKLLDVRRYCGSFLPKFNPDIDLVLEMIEKFKNSAPAYTLDVGVSSSRGTFLIEAHNFYSVGLYGFSVESIPQMISQTFYWLLER
jgi:hypothetical protein